MSSLIPLRELNLQPAEQALVDAAASFGRAHFGESGAAAPDFRKLLKAACVAGLAGAEASAAQGGAAGTFAAVVRICETLAAWHTGFAFSLVNHQNVVARIAADGSDAAKQRWLADMLSGDRIGCTAMTEPQSGSDFAALRTRAQRHGNTWVLNGAKAWITNTAYADVLIVYAQTDPAAGIAGVGAFLVDAQSPGFERGPIYTGMGTEGTGVGEFKLHDCEVPASAVLFPPGAGFKRAMRGVNRARIYVAAINATMIEVALRTALHYTSKRQAFGQPIVSFQGIGWSLATVAMHMQAMHALADAGVRAEVRHEDTQAIAAMAKKYANDHAGLAITACMQAMGAQGLQPHSGLERLLGWARALCCADGTPEMMNERIAALLRKA